MNTNASLGGGAFQKNLAFGQAAESAIARWLIRRGNAVMPVYDIEYETGKGPRLFCNDGQFAAPDLVGWKNGKCTWFEAKHKSVFTWRRMPTRRSGEAAWQTGIDHHHWRHYQEVARRTGMEIWLLFLHRIATPDARDLRHGCPPACPTGLFGDEISRLGETFAHVDGRWGRHGMIYWNQADLLFLDRLENVI